MGTQPAARSPEPDTEELLNRAARGDRTARNRLFDRQRRRLRALVALHLDRRLAARVDPSDVVQESLAEANAKLGDYLRSRPLPFYVWLRELALERLVDLHRLHIRSQKRSVVREEMPVATLTDDSMAALAQHFVDHGSDPGAHAQRQELNRRLRSAIDRLRERDREVLVLRHLEQLSVREIAALLKISEGAVKVRHLRALQRLRKLLGHLAEEL